jgi:hypothetical protein
MAETIMGVHHQARASHQWWHINPALGLCGAFWQAHLQLFSMGAVMLGGGLQSVGFGGVFRQPSGPQVVHQGPILGNIWGALES